MRTSETAQLYGLADRGAAAPLRARPLRRASCAAGIGHDPEDRSFAGKEQPRLLGERGGVVVDAPLCLDARLGVPTSVLPIGDRQARVSR